MVVEESDITSVQLGKVRQLEPFRTRGISRLMYWTRTCFARRSTTRRKKKMVAIQWQPPLQLIRKRIIALRSSYKLKLCRSNNFPWASAQSKTKTGFWRAPTPWSVKTTKKTALSSQLCHKAQKIVSSGWVASRLDFRHPTSEGQQWTLYSGLAWKSWIMTRNMWCAQSQESLD